MVTMAVFSVGELTRHKHAEDLKEQKYIQIWTYWLFSY